MLIHVEVQAQPQPNVAQRMFDYHVRIRAAFGRSVLSMAILIDERRTWDTGHYEDELWGCKIQFDFPFVKLTDYRDRLGELEASDNPFATVILAHLASRSTSAGSAERAGIKLSLVRRLYERGYNRKQIVGLFRFIDWVLQLPAELEWDVWRQIQQLQEERGMPYITSIERLARQEGIAEGLEIGRQEGRQEGRHEGRQEGRQEGRREGMLAGLALALEFRFGAAGLALAEELERVADTALLERVASRLGAGATVEELRDLPPPDGG